MSNVPPGSKPPSTAATQTVTDRPPKRRNLRATGRCLVILILIAASVYRFQFAAVPVSIHQAEQGTIVGEVMGTGTLEARVRTTISPKIAGRIREILVDQGDTVEAGQNLLSLNDAELTQQVAVAQAGVDTAVASIERLKADVIRATAVVAQAEKRLARIRSLSDKKVATEDALDDVIEAHAVADAGLLHAKAALVEGQQQLVTTQKTLNYHKARLADTVIQAPFAGLVVQRRRDPGDVIVPGSDVLTVISTDELWISAWVDETEMGRLQPGQSARVIFRSEPERDWPGEVIRLGRQADRETREFIVDVRVRELPDNWAVGQRAEVYIEFDRRENVVMLPAKLIVLREGQPGVYTLNDGRAVWKAVVPGLRNADSLEIKDGLPSNSTVVIPPSDGEPDSLEGRRVTVQ